LSRLEKADQYFRGLFITVLIAYKCHINKQHIPQNSGFILILRCLLFTDKMKYRKTGYSKDKYLRWASKRLWEMKMATG